MMKDLKGQNGFTLIETLVYLALFAILFGGAAAACYAVIETGGRNLTKAMVQEEGNFMLAKINWALSGVQTIDAPNANFSGSLLSVNKITSVDASGNPVSTDVVIDLDPLAGVCPQAFTCMRLTLGNPPASRDVNNSATKIVNLEFTRSKMPGDGPNPESVRAEFDVSARTPNGAQFTQHFETANYLRK